MQAFAEDWRKFRQEQQNYIYSYDPMDESKAEQIKAFVLNFFVKPFRPQSKQCLLCAFFLKKIVKKG